MRRRDVSVIQNSDEGRLEVKKVFAGIRRPGGLREKGYLNLGLVSAPKLYRSEISDESVTLYVEYIEGIDADQIDWDSKTKGEKIAFAKSLCQAIMEFHEKGLFVGDIKLSNIRIDHGRVVLVDLSFVFDAELGPEHTPGYECPEFENSYPVVPGRKTMVGRPTDIYCLGIILHQMDPMFQNVAKACNAFWVGDRPGPRAVLRMIKRIELKRPAMLISSLLSLLLFGVFLLGSLTSNTSDVKSVIRAILNDTPSTASIWAARRHSAQMSLQEKVEAALEIARHTSTVQVRPDNLDAAFAFSPPALLFGDQLLGAGSQIELPDRTRGIIVDILLHPRAAVTLSTPDGLVSWELQIDNQVGFDGIPAIPIDEPPTMVVFPDGNNLGHILDGLCAIYGLDPVGKIDGIIAGWFSGPTGIHFLEKHAEQLGLQIDNGQFQTQKNTVGIAVPIFSQVWITDLAQPIAEKLKIEVRSDFEVGEPFLSLETSLIEVLEYFAVTPTIKGNTLFLEKSDGFTDEN